MVKKSKKSKKSKKQIVWIQAYRDGKRSFLTDDDEQGVLQLIDSGELQIGKEATAGELKINLIEVSDFDGEIRGDGDRIILPALSETINVDVLQDWVDWSGSLKPILIVLWLNQQVAFVGEKGTGKNQITEVIGKLFGVDYYEISGSDDLTSYDLVGKYAPSDNPNKVAEWIDGDFTKWAKTGGVLNFDEPNVCRGGVLLRVHPIIDFRRHIALKEHEGEIINRGDDSHLILSFNPPKSEYLGVEVMNISFLDRFAVFEFDYPPADLEQQIIDSKNGIILTKRNAEWELRIDRLVQAANNIRQDYQGGRLHDTVSTRQLKLANSLSKAGVDADTVLSICISNRFFNSDRDRVQELLEVAKERKEGTGEEIAEDVE